MENKLQQLTQKLYDEGLERGRTESAKLISDAEAKAQAIIDEAKAEAQRIVKTAEEKAADVAKNSQTEIALAGKQSVAKIKSEIASLVVAKSVTSTLKDAAMDAAFVKELLVEVAKSWRVDSVGRVELVALLPEALRTKFDAELKASADKALLEGVEVGYSASVKSGFKLSQKDAGYYISFSDSDLEALLSEYMRQQVAQIIFNA